MTFKRVEEVTEKQAEIWTEIVGHVCKYGYQPSLKEMADRRGVSPVAIGDRIRQLAAKGLIDMPRRRQERCFLLKYVRLRAEHHDKKATKLDEAEASVWKSLVDFVSESCYQPTILELAVTTGFHHKWVSKIMERLVAKGYLEPPDSPKQARSYKLRFVSFTAELGAQ